MTRLGILVLVAAMVLPVGGRTEGVDHLKCYKIDAPRTFRAIVDLETELTGLEPGCTVASPQLLCLPAKKTVVKLQDSRGAPREPLPISGPAAGMKICYRIQCPRDKVPDLELVDQFGVLPMKVRETSLLCAPAEVCEPVCSSDADCDDANECTQDICNNPGSCTALCTSAFLQDTACSGGVCCLGTCVPPVCVTNADCDDANECTQDVCANPGSCNALCASALLPNGTLCSLGVCCSGTCTSDRLCGP
jgi:hypothetical protein